MVMLVIGSAWFFPVCCAGILYVGTHAAACLDARETSRGDQVHSTFQVVAEPGEGGMPFRIFSLSEFKVCGESTGCSFLMSKPDGNIDVDKYRHVSYRVVRDEGSAQVIEVTARDDDKTVWSRYRATAGGVAPISSRMFHPGYMFRTIPAAFGGAAILYGVGRLLRRRFPTGGWKG